MDAHLQRGCVVSARVRFAAGFGDSALSPHDGEPRTMCRDAMTFVVPAAVTRSIPKQFRRRYCALSGFAINFNNK
ncbi:hypothetical protein [Burkholderia pseudomallei]|uniref:hypothetical protein n=1 Tax=Burkholderia pseudomallei TaxID=28450 RepID=UPI0012AEC0C5|nr:hypothetical protein [Burkholderia pseudomallei]